MHQHRNPIRKKKKEVLQEQTDGTKIYSYVWWKTENVSDTTRKQIFAGGQN